uniref:Zinc finger protein 407 n=1 Tax=Sphaeramia orbicularis TaxID=375764 RepID=A0A673A1X8_9TELE
MEESTESVVCQDGDDLCTICGFLAKCPRSLKIHYARKHGKNTKDTSRSTKPAEGESIDNVSSTEIQEDMETQSAPENTKQQCGPDEVRSSPTDDKMNTKGGGEIESTLAKQQTDEEEMTPTLERRVSKRTPKPKIIYSCNYCGQEFRDKSPLDKHVQRYHTKDTPYTCEYLLSFQSKSGCFLFDADENMDEGEASEDPVSHVNTIQTHAASKRPLSRFQLKCDNCDFRVSTPALLENHTRVTHPDRDWYHCKLCKVFSATSEWMDAHLSSDQHQQNHKGETSADSSSVQVYVEKVSRQSVGEAATEGLNPGSDGDHDTGESGTVLNVALDEEEEEEEESEIEPPRKKRGKPKQGSSTTCGYCGLVVSNATNLSVHVRRKHSKEYGYSCTLCNYSCVTKGDMDRHCITKKHVKRLQECATKNPDSSKASPAPEEPTTTEVQDLNEPLQTEKEQEPDATATEDLNREGDTQADTSQKKTKYDSVNACSHCDFVAQSIPSLHLHVKRKHTKDFEYVCLACSYYAVTSREMLRHANTEKHKHKSQRYLEHLGTEGQKTPKDVMQMDGESPNPECAPLSPNEDSRKGQDAPEEAPKTTTKTTNQNQRNGRSTVSDVHPGPEEVQSEQDKEQKQADSEGFDADAVPDAKANSAHSDAQIPKNPSFDACIVSIKTLSEQEQLQEGLAILVLILVLVLILKVRDDVKGNSARIRCEDCGFMADGISGLNVHISMKHPSKEKHFHCLVCGKSFYTESNLHQHLTSAAHLRNEQNSVEELPEGGASFKCVKCTERFMSEQDLFVHIKEKHEELLREVNKYVLEDTEQINREREENQGSVCKYCGKVCKSSNSMAFLAHIRTHTGSKPFMCKICNFATAQLGDARNHVKRHLGMREYKCDIYGLCDEEHLSTHLLGKHGVGQRKERKFECGLCERSFSEKWALNNHMKLHSGEKPYKCEWPSCHYAFLNLSAMKDHYRTHTGEKSYLCDLCGFAGGTRHALTKHRRQHTGERPFKCKFCSFASTTQSHLSRHKRVHTGEKPYGCPWCDYRSNCAENIRKHILHTGKHEGVKMYNCPKCSYATNSPSEFRNHLKENHPDIENPDLAYLHAGIVSKSFECRLKGQGAAFVEAEAVGSPLNRKCPSQASGHGESVQQVIIIQGYGEGEVSIDQALEESAAATLQTLAMAGQVAEVLHITEDGQVIASGREVASAGAHLTGGATQYVVLESGEAREELQAVARGGVAVRGAGQSHVVSESSTALDALLSAVTEMGQQEETHGEAAVVHELIPPEVTPPEEGVPVKQEQEEVQVIHDGGQEEMQEVLQLAASQMMKEGLTQVIVNDEGTHYIVTELGNCTLQVEEGVYGEATGGGAEAPPEEEQEEEGRKEMVVYVDGTPHNIVLEG